MANLETTKQALENVPKQKSLIDLINASAKELGRALPSHLNAERLTRIALTCIRLNPELAKCTPESFLGALFTAAQLGIEPVAGRAYLIPFYNSKKQPDGSWKKVLECQFVMGYRGVSELFYRHEKAVEISWGVIRGGDEVDWAEGTDAHLNVKPLLGNKGVIKAYYATAKLNNGGRPFKLMSAEDCIAHGIKHSKTYDKTNKKFYDSSPWATNTEAMCLKTCLIQLAKLLPLSVELQRAIEADETSREFRKGIDSALDLPVTTNWKEEAVESETNEKVEITKGKSATEIEFGE